MHRANAPLAQAFFQAEVEIRRIHADEDIGLFLQKAIPQLAPDTPQAEYTLEHFQVVAMHRQQLAGPQHLKTLLRHARPANAAGLPLRPVLAHALQQQAGQQIARGFASDHANAQGFGIHIT